MIKHLFSKMSLLAAIMVMAGGSAWAADKWVKTAPADLTTGDVVVIVDQTSGTAMSNNNGTSSAPSATSVTLSGDKSEISSEVASTLQWVVTVNNGSYQFGVSGTEDYLYCTATNNGVRVGTNTNNAFTVYDNSGVDFLVNTATSRYIGVYISQDWRCYTSINNNIKNSVTAFYKKVADGKTAIATIGDLDVTTLDFEAEGTFAPAITLADGISTGDYTVAWTEVNNDYILLTADGEYVAGTTKGSTSVTVTVTPSEAKADSYEAVSKTFTVKIVDPNANDGLSEAKAFTCAEAIEALDAGDVDGTATYYVKGIINTLQKFNDDNSITYWIADDGQSKQFEIYKGFGINGAEFSSIDDLEVGDEVVVKGKLLKYNATTYELNAGNELVSRKTKADPELSFATASYTVNINADFDTPTLTNPHDLTVTYASSDVDLAVVDEDTGDVLIGDAEGTVTITASFAGNDSYKAGSASYTITIEDQRKAAPISFAEAAVSVKVADAKSYAGQTLTNGENLTVTYTMTGDEIGSIGENDGTVVLDGTEGTATITATFAGNNTYKATTAQYTITVYAPVVFAEFYESFDQNNGLDGWSGSAAGKSLTTDNVWKTDNPYGGYMCARFGTGKKQGTATTPALKLDPEVTYVLTFKAGAWSNDAQKLKISSTDAIFNGSDATEVELADANWSGYYIELTAGNPETTITFSGNATNNARFFLDEVRVMEKTAFDALALNQTVSSNGWATYIPAYNVSFADGDAYVVTAVDKAEGTITIEPVTSVPAKTPVLLKGAGEKTITAVTEAVEAPALNKLTISNGTFAAAEYPYVLAKDGDGAGFKQWTGEASVLNGRVVLVLDFDQPSEGRMLRFADGEATAISSLSVDAVSNNRYYNLQGQIIAAPQKGLYIVNGKKVVVK